MTTEPTPEMVQLIYSRIDFVNHGDDGIAEGLADVFALVEKEHEIELAKLRGAFELASDSRSLWKRRALDAGWRPSAGDPS